MAPKNRDTESETAQRKDFLDHLFNKSAPGWREIFFWVACALIALREQLIALARGEGSEIFYRENSAGNLVLAIAIIMGAVLCRLIFGQFPLQLFFGWRGQRPQRPAAASPKADDADSIDHQEEEHLAAIPSYAKLGPYTADEVLAWMALSSRKISRSIYTRAGVYLLVGASVAFSGLMFFYMMSARSPASKAYVPEVARVEANPENSPHVEWQAGLLELAPRFGILFFIEFVAFFFLRQYRAAMEEFRYYEALKRRREELWLMIKIFQGSGKDWDLSALIKEQHFYTVAGRMGKEDTTEIIESRKLEKDDLELLVRILEVVKAKKA